MRKSSRQCRLAMSLVPCKSIIYLCGCHGNQLTTAAINANNTHFHKEPSYSEKFGENFDVVSHYSGHEDS